MVPPRDSGFVMVAPGYGRAVPAIRVRAARFGWAALVISFASHALGAVVILEWRGSSPLPSTAEPVTAIEVDVMAAPTSLPDPGTEAQPRPHPRPRRAAPRPRLRSPKEALPGSVPGPAPAPAEEPAPVDLTRLTFGASRGVALASRPGDTSADWSGGTSGGSAGSAAGRARAVGLEDKDWHCPWPDQADAMEKNREDVVIRVVVTAEGRVVSARVLRDPGNGFAQAAINCARETHFVPALDAHGVPTPAESPAIRVRFGR